MERVLQKYQHLDLLIRELKRKYEQQSDCDSDELRRESGFESSRNFDLRNSLNEGRNTGKLYKELAYLQRTSNLQLYQIKLRELQENPSDFESFLYQLKKELKTRQKSFKALKGKLIK